MNLIQNNKREHLNLIPNIDLNSDSADLLGSGNHNKNLTSDNQSDPIHLGKLRLKWASHQGELLQAQRLRHNVFTQEMGTELPVNTRSDGLDQDLFDDFCEHLIVQDLFSGEVVGTYRVLTPTQAQRVGGSHLSTHFDLTRLRHYKDLMVEIGKGCVHPAYRNGGVLMALWSELCKFMRRNEFELMVGCTAIPMNQELPRSARVAAGVWSQLKSHHLAPIELQIRARSPLPVDQLEPLPCTALPPLIQAYLRLGAKVLGPPAWVANSSCVDLPMMMRSSELHRKYQKHFLGL
jgi:putative hemolysin